MDKESFAQDPWPHFESARTKHPWMATCAFGFVVTQYDAMKDLLLMDDSLYGAYEDIVDIMEARGTSWGRFQLEMVLNLQGPMHKRIRDVLAPAFTPRQAIKHRPLMRKVILELLRDWVPRKKFDFEEFASYFPIGVMCSLLGAPLSAIPSLRSSMETFGLSVSMQKNLLPKLVEAMDTLDAFSQDLVAKRRKARLPKGEEDMLELLINAQESGGLTERELYDMMVFLFVAGYDTSKNALTILMSILIDRPDDYKRCAEDQAFCAKVVEEAFRYNTTSTIPRVTAKDVTYRGVEIPKGTVIFFPVSIAGRDQTGIPDRELFKPERTHDVRHIAFGRGAHMCLGQHIARAQIEEGLHLIAQTMKNPRRTGSSGWRPFFGVWGLKGLPIEIDPAPIPTN
jgi:cytochrome P450